MSPHCSYAAAGLGVGVELQPPSLADLFEGHDVWLGVEVSSRQGAGVKVTKVNPRSPAERAKIVVGDVLLAIEGKSLDRPERVAELIKIYAAGSRLRMKVERKGQKIDLTVTLQPPPRE